MTDRIHYTRESDLEFPSVTGTPQRIGGATIGCPNCGAELRTEDALIRAEIPNGLRFQGLACAGCGSSFTVELTEAPT